MDFISTHYYCMNEHKPEPWEEILKTAVNRFLGWRLPADFSPDGGIGFQKGTVVPIGTHLFTAQQAEEMFKYVLQEAFADQNTANAERIRELKIVPAVIPHHNAYITGVNETAEAAARIVEVHK